MEKLKMESVSIAEDSLNKIAELFPNVVTESMGNDGQLHKAIDFDAMKLLKKSYAGKVDVIYIDPPYNTGKDFIFNDTFALSQEESDEKQGRYNEEGQRLFFLCFPGVLQARLQHIKLHRRKFL